MDLSIVNLIVWFDFSVTQLLYLMSAFQNKIKRVYLPHKKKCSMFYTHIMQYLTQIQPKLITELGIPCETISFFRVWSVSVASVWLILHALWRHGVYVY